MIGISSLNNLHPLALRAKDDDDSTDMAELMTTFNAYSSTLTHLCLPVYLARPPSWDSAFQSLTVDHLTRLELVDIKVSYYVLRRVVTCSERLTHLKIPEVPRSSSERTMCWSCHLFLPYLESFGFLAVDHDSAMALYPAVMHFAGDEAASKA